MTRLAAVLLLLAACGSPAPDYGTGPGRAAADAAYLGEVRIIDPVTVPTTTR